MERWVTRELRSTADKTPNSKAVDSRSILGAAGSLIEISLYRVQSLNVNVVQKLNTFVFQSFKNHSVKLDYTSVHEMNIALACKPCVESAAFSIGASGMAHKSLRRICAA